MGITRTQMYQQLVKKPSGKERPGYRGSDTGKADASDFGLGDRPGRDDKAISNRMAQTQQMADYNKQQERDKLKEELILTPIGRNKPLNKISLFNNRYQRNRLINLAKKRADQKYRDLENYVVGDTDMEYDFTGLPEGLKDLKTTTGTRPNLYDVNPSMNIPSALSLLQDKIRPDTQVTAQNTLQKARDYMGILDNVSNMSNKDIRDTITDLGNRGKTEDQINPRGGDVGQPILPQYMMPTPSITDQEPEQTELQQLIASMRSPGGIATRFLAEGGMADEFIGGAADGGLDAMGRQMYGLGKIVKKATRAVKKIVKSPVGKAALAYGLTFGIPGVKGDGFFSKGLSGLFSSGAEKKSFMDMIGGKAGLGILGASALAGLTTPDEDEDQLTEEELRGPGLDLAAIRANPNMYLAPRFQAQEGGKAEPVAKKVMPLLDMDGMEKDYRETGGFVPIGRMEKADDVPARLSKNEFVFTADAVRNAGDGDIDKGAEVMYNMMKHLEDGGDVSEESQGLEGARNMFQTSQRLEEVL